MLSLFKTQQESISPEEKLLSMTERQIRNELPPKLRQTGLFTEDEISRAIELLVDFRSKHSLEVIE